MRPKFDGPNARQRAAAARAIAVSVAVGAGSLSEKVAQRRIHLATARGREFRPATKVLIEQLLTRPIDEDERTPDR
ncbi:hypothetical protein [Nocardia amikacinitolerans]|uniref:hypothetical protein n=1 Tax=Nocardia amikacinitolerans TaxID=756689 RepID=UPI000BE3F432|nr:hypothetical protein [Nocardia amikacinitolerans]